MSDVGMQGLKFDAAGPVTQVRPFGYCDVFVFRITDDRAYSDWVVMADGEGVAVETRRRPVFRVYTERGALPTFAAVQDAALRLRLGFAASTIEVPHLDFMAAWRRTMGYPNPEGTTEGE